MKRNKRQRNVKLESKAAPVKITGPVVAGVYPRTRLFRQLDHARKRPVVWLSAPAGSGKTTLVASYLQNRGLAALWYQMDAGDNDIASFFYFIGLGAQAAAPKRRDRLPLLTQEYQAGLSTFAINYFRDYFSQLKAPSIVVFDDYHEVAIDGRIQDIIQLGLEQIPKGINVVVVSRELPPRSFARSREHIALLEWQHLKLTEQESAGVIKLRGKRTAFSNATISRLHQDTQGWIAGLVLLAESTAQAPNDYAQLQKRTKGTIFDYFASEIFRRSDNATQEFLLKTAILPTVTIDVAQSLAGVDNAQAIFETLTRRNLFTFRRAEGSFEYHPLFRAFLVEQANTRYSKEQMKVLKQIAAQLLVKGGEFEAAVELLIQAHDWPAAIELLLAHAGKLVEQGRTQTLSGWLGELPQSFRFDNPRVLFWLGTCNMAASPGAARELLRQAFVLFEKQDDASWLYRSWCAIVGSFVIEWKDFSGLVPWLDRFHSLTGSRKPPNPAIEAVSIFSYVTGLLWARADDPDLPLYAARAESLFMQEVDAERRLELAAVRLLPYHLWVGDLGKFREIYSYIARHPLTPRARPMVRLNWCVAKAQFEGIAGAPQSSIDAVTEGLAIAAESGVHIFDVLLCGHGVWSLLSVGNVNAARSLLERMSPWVNGNNQQSYYRHFVAMVLIHENQGRRAVDEANRALELAKYDVGSVSGLLCLASALTSVRDTDAALSRLNEARALAQRMRSELFVANCNLLEAHIQRLVGNRAQSLYLLGRFLIFANTFGLIVPGYILRSDAVDLLSFSLGENAHVEEIKRWAVKTSLPPPRQDAGAHWPWPLKVFTLGRFAVMKGGSTLTSTGKTQKKPLELLRVIVAFGGRDVGIAKVTQALWPDTDGDKARITLRSTLLRLRRLVGEEAIAQNGNYLSLNPQHCWLDVWALDQLSDHRDGSAAPFARAERLFNLYRGAFLPDDDELWLINQRDRLRSKALRLIMECGGELEDSDQIAAAADLYQKGIEADPLAEDLYRKLMRCYSRQDRQAAALALYQRCRATLRRSLQIEPTPETVALYEEIKGRVDQCT